LILREHGFLKLHVVPNAKITEIISIDTDDAKVSMRIQAVPDKGKANKEIISFFKKQCKLTVEIVKGQKSRDKIIQLR